MIFRTFVFMLFDFTVFADKAQNFNNDDSISVLMEEFHIIDPSIFMHPEAKKLKFIKKIFHDDQFIKLFINIDHVESKGDISQNLLFFIHNIYNGISKGKLQHILNGFDSTILIFQNTTQFHELVHQNLQLKINQNIFFFIWKLKKCLNPIQSIIERFTKK